MLFVKSDSDSEADGRRDNREQAEEDKEQNAGATDLHCNARRSASRKVAHNEHSGSQMNGGKSNDAGLVSNRSSKCALTVVQESAPSSDDDCAGRRGKRQKTSKK